MELFKRPRIKLRPHEYRSLRDRVFKRDGYCCVICGQGSNLHMHHVIYRSQQGDDREDNCVTLDYICHERVHTNRDIRERLHSIFEGILQSNKSESQNAESYGPKCVICGKETYKLTESRCDKCRVYFKRTGMERPTNLPILFSKKGNCRLCGKSANNLMKGKCGKCHYYSKRYGFSDPKMMINRVGWNRRNNHNSNGHTLIKHHFWKGNKAGPEAKRQRAVRRIKMDLCELCGKPGMDRHHFDSDLDNLKFNNIHILCRKCHMKVDGRQQKLRERIKIYQKKTPRSPCLICGKIKGYLRKGRCHRCNEYFRRNGKDRNLNKATGGLNEKQTYRSEQPPIRTTRTPER